MGITMTITSFYFLLFFAISLGIYYLLPLRCRWVALLVFSVVFFHFSAVDYTLFYAVVCVLVTTVGARGIAGARAEGNEKKAKIFLVVGLVTDFGILALLKYSNFFIRNVNFAFRVLGGSDGLPLSNLVAPLGISFYTFQAAGYLIDVYLQACPAQPNVMKTALFVGYYPQLTSGPIVRYNQMKDQLYVGHRFHSRQIAFGMQRMLWGFFKKLVISERLAVVVNTIYGDTATYGGFYIWIAAVFFPLQLYTDFSGCMDIVSGASECYGIQLPDNFKTPFFSRSVQEFWQRWHITLGGWMRDYVLYPVLHTELWRKMTRWIKAKWGRKAAKQIPNILGMLCVWLLMGIWHGGTWSYIFGNGIWYWLCITCAMLLDPVFKKMISRFCINTECFSWHLFQSLRVYGIVCIGNMFFRIQGFLTTLHTIKAGLFPHNPEIFFDGSLYALGLDQKNFGLLMFCLLILLIVSILQQKYGSLRDLIAKQNIVFRWVLWYALIFGVLIFGMYGPGYNPADFIYQGF